MASCESTSPMRWEDHAGLEHSCWMCATKANSPKALKTCYGIHSIPCLAYHPTMHAICAAHRCSACRTNREMHEARHREIAELLAEYKTLKFCIIVTPKKQRRLTERPGDMIERAPGAGPILFDPDHRDDIAIDENDEHDVMAAELNGEVENDQIDRQFADLTAKSPQKKLSKTEQRAQKRALKSAKSQGKAMKNQSRNLAAVTAADIEEVAKILHGESYESTASSHPLVTDSKVEDVIERNLGFVKQIGQHRRSLYASINEGRKDMHERQRLKRKEEKGEYTDVKMNELVNAILVKLGIDVGSGITPKIAGMSLSNHSTRKRAGSLAGAATATNEVSSRDAARTQAAIAQKLAVLIRVDLEKHENDIAETCKRAAAFWRYADNKVFVRMLKLAEKYDLRTGEKRKVLNEDEEEGENVENEEENNDDDEERENDGDDIVEELF